MYGINLQKQFNSQNSQRVTLLNKTTLRVSISLHLGSEICKPHKCSWRTLVNTLGTHGLSCQKSSGRSSRHAAINIIKRTLASVGLPSVLEPVGLGCYMRRL
ncbi:hypothetical protein ILUMI_00243 [Ignelater luminosus]|uniref:Uncharacterized protein n=1 Tax=Ignelater luminosus TaxID=2038154 RepID=A0A8K0GMU0_IGNLU|nr:hypothetical protein ILUMI_00243 [Ignelater luminosus]